MHAEFLQDLALVMIVAGLVTVMFHQIRQPVVLGYILAGILVGPHTSWMPTVRDDHAVETLADLGMILLMFSLGIHFSFRRLAKVGVTALIAASLEIVLMVWLGYLVGRLFDWSQMDSLFLGAILSISSTTIIVKALTDLRRLREPFAELIFGILIIEDVLAIAMIALLSGVAVTGTVNAGEVAGTLGQLALFLTMVVIIGLLVTPLLLRYVAKFESREMMLVTALGLCFGVSLLAAHLGYSVALGAFLIGAIVAETRQRGEIEKLVEPVRDMFSAVFFVAVGMLIEPALLFQYAVPILVISLAVVIGKIATSSLGTFVSGHDMRTSLRVGMGLAQIGEFSFIIAQLGLTLKVTSNFLYPIAVTVSVVTTLLTPLLLKRSDSFVALFERTAPRPLQAYLKLYHRWVAGARGESSGPNPVRKLVRKTILQLLVNSVLMAGVFIAAAYASQRLQSMPRFARHPDRTKSALWLAAMIVSLPLLAATLRIRAMAMLLAEILVTRRAAGEQVVAIRGVVSNIILLAGGAALGLLLLVLSTAILPPLPVLAVLAAGLTILAVVMWRSFIQMYAKAQIALGETLSDGHATEEPPPAPVMPSVLQNAVLRLITIGPASPAADQSVRSLQLRQKTGANAVAIDRNGQSIVNPGPDEKLQPGDKILLLGDEPQVEAARELMTGE